MFNSINQSVHIDNHIVMNILHDGIMDNDIESNLETYSNDNLCSICLEKNDFSSEKLTCGCVNKFHKKCVGELKKNNINKCPICRRQLNEITHNPIHTFEYERDYNEHDEYAEYAEYTEYNQDNEFINNHDYIITILKSTIQIVSMLFMCFVALTLTYHEHLKHMSINTRENLCDNTFKKCSIYHTTGFLLNYTINNQSSNYNFTHKNEYIVNQYYHYKDIFGKNKTCSVSKFYDSYLDLNQVLVAYPIGSTKNIYISQPLQLNNTIYCNFYDYNKPTLYLIYLIWKMNIVLSFVMAGIFIVVVSYMCVIKIIKFLDFNRVFRICNRYRRYTTTRTINNLYSWILILYGRCFKIVTAIICVVIFFGYCYLVTQLLFIMYLSFTHMDD